MLLFLFLVTYALAAPDAYISIPEDPHDVDSLTEDLDEVKVRVDCFIDRQPCTELTEVYKSLIPDIVRRECTQCSDYIKHYHNVFLKTVKENYPDEYQAYRHKYDPEGIHFDALEAAVTGY